MRFLLAAALLSALAIPAAHADITTFTISGTDTNSNPFSINFSLDPATYIDNQSTFEYTGVSGTVNGTSDSFLVDAAPYSGVEYFNIQDTAGLFPDEGFELYANNGVNFLDGDPDSGLPPTVTLGTYAGIDYTNCPISASIKPFRSGLSPTMAFLQMPSITVDCNAPVSLNVAGPSTSSSVTPEPSSLALLATGTLGVAGVIRRRIVS
jgi:hypothetical protein